ncbi:MAG: hypothetical protein CMJ59_04110 [Planctomycetaceae bacterium]|nr:hypothetical protein [Planctomycetaceae bacterium]
MGSAVLVRRFQQSVADDNLTRTRSRSTFRQVQPQGRVRRICYTPRTAAAASRSVTLLARSVLATLLQDPNISQPTAYT